MVEMDKLGYVMETIYYRLSYYLFVFFIKKTLHKVLFVIKYILIDSIIS